jgi:acyl-CoA reductase-like NAD-dependent aldehyde dehydrogenase
MPATDKTRRLVEQALKNPDIASLLASGVTAAAEESRQAGVFADVDSAVRAAGTAQKDLVFLPLETRSRMIAAMRRAVLAENESLSREAVAETGLGTIASPTGEGLTRARTFTRERRCTLVGCLRIV